MIKFKCSNCNHTIGAPEKYAGKRVRCPKCKVPTCVPEPIEKTGAQKQGLIKFRCPNCNQKIGVTPDYAGKHVRCAKCRNPLRVPQVSGQSGRSTVKDETAVLKSGQEQRPTDEGVWGDMGSLDELLLAETPAPSIERQVEQRPVEYGAGESEFSEYTGKLSEPGSLAEGGVREGVPKKRRSVIFIVAGCVLGLLLVGTVLWYLLADSGTRGSKVKIREAQGFAEQYIDLLEDGEIDRAREFLSPGLATDVQKDEIERFAKQLNKSEIVGLECGVKNFKEHPEGNQFYLCYTVRYENENQRIAVSILEIDEELKIDGIAIKEPFGVTISIGLRSFEELEGIAFAAAFEKFRSIFTKFFCGFLVVVFAIGLLQVVAMWVVFDKAGQPGWAVLVPIYNMWVLAEVGDKPGWWGLLMCFCGFIPFIGPIVGFVLSVVILIGVARAFGRGVGFGIGLSLVPFVFYPILAFSSD